MASDSSQGLLPSQRYPHRIGYYMDAACAVIAADSVQGLFRRGLKTRVLTNGLQGVVLWKMLLYL